MRALPTLTKFLRDYQNDAVSPGSKDTKTRPEAAEPWASRVSGEMLPSPGGLGKEAESFPTQGAQCCHLWGSPSPKAAE